MRCHSPKACSPGRAGPPTGVVLTIRCALPSYPTPWATFSLNGKPTQVWKPFVTSMTNPHWMQSATLFFGSGARAGKFSFGRYRAAGAGRNEEENQAMRLSQAILLGSTLLRPVAGDLELPGDCGALGMAKRAVGAGWSYWPWLLTMRLAAPCRCPF